MRTRPLSRTIAAIVAMVATFATLTSLTTAAVADEPAPAEHEAAPAGFSLPDLAMRDRVGARVSLGYAEIAVPGAPNEQGFALFTIEPFARFAVAPSLVLYGSVPVTWTEGENLSGGGELANVTGGVLYAPGEFAAGAELSVNVGHAPAAHAALNRFELDHFADDTVALRLHANVEHRAGKLRLAGEFAVMVLADNEELGALVRLGGGVGLDLPRGWTAIAEYLVLTDALEERFPGDDDFFQALNLGARRTLDRDRGTVGLHLHVPLDRAGNEDTVGAGMDFAGAF